MLQSTCNKHVQRCHQVTVPPHNETGLATLKTPSLFFAYLRHQRSSLTGRDLAAQCRHDAQGKMCQGAKLEHRNPITARDPTTTSSSSSNRAGAVFPWLRHHHHVLTTTHCAEYFRKRPRQRFAVQAEQKTGWCSSGVHRQLRVHRTITHCHSEGRHQSAQKGTHGTFTATTQRRRRRTGSASSQIGDKVLK